MSALKLTHFYDVLLILADLGGINFNFIQQNELFHIRMKYEINTYEVKNLKL